MSATFKSQIESLAGTIPSSIVDDDLDTILASGCKDIIRRTELTNAKDLWLFTNTSAYTEDGVAVNSGLLYDVNRGTKPCKQITPNLRFRCAESDSIHFSTGEFPVYYMLDSKVYILPAPGANLDIVIETFSDADGDGYRTQIETSTSHNFVVNDFIIISQGSDANKYYVGYYKVEKVVDGIKFVIARDYQNVSATQGTYSCKEPGATVTSLNIPSAVESDGYAIGSFPTSYYHYVTLYGAVSVLMRRMADLNDNLPTVTVPVAPIAPTLSTNNQDLPALTLPAPFILPVPPDDLTIDFSDVPTRPSYTVIPPPSLSTIDFSIENLTIDNLSLSVEPPVIPESPVFSDGAMDFSTTVRNKVPVYTAPILSVPDYPVIPNVELIEPPVAPPGANFSSGTSNASSSNQPNYSPPVLQIPQWDQIDTFIQTEEDTELASAQVQKIQAQVAVFQADISNALNIYRQDMDIYEKIIQEEMKNAELTVNKENQEYQAQLSAFQSEIQLYQSKNSSIVDKWSKENIDTRFAEWNQKFTYSLQQYQHDIANNLNIFNKEVIEYQQEVAKAQQDANNKQSSENQEYQAKLSRFQSELENYKGKTANEVIEWQSQEVQVKMTKFTQIRSDEIQKYSQEEQMKMTRYSSEIQERGQQLSNELNIWNGEITKASQKFQTENSAEQALYTALVQAEGTRWSAEIQKATEKSKNEMEKFSARQQQIAEENQSKVQKWTAATAIWSGESQTVLTEFQALIEKDSKRYEWCTAQLQLLRQQYDAGFLSAQPEEEGAR